MAPGVGGINLTLRRTKRLYKIFSYLGIEKQVEITGSPLFLNIPLVKKHCNREPILESNFNKRDSFTWFNDTFYSDVRV